MKRKITASVVIFILFTTLAFELSTFQRYWQFAMWNKDREIIYPRDGRIPMATLDSYHWTRLAKEYNKGNFGKGRIDALRNYPDNNIYFTERPNMLVYLLGKFGNFFNGDVYRAGIYLIPILSSLFIVPLAVYFYKIGLESVGIAGGLFGTFTYAYNTRTANGYVDTDALNLFFPIFVGLFFLLITEARRKRYQYLCAAIAGLGMWLFSWWYEKPGFAVVYAFLLVLHLLVNRFKIKEIVVLVSIYVLFCNPYYFHQGLRNILYFIFSGYLHGQVVEVAGVAWPNIKTTISESQKTPTTYVLNLLAGNKYLAIAGIVGILIVFVLKFKQMIPLIPLLVLGGLAFVSGSRFAIYLAPLVWVGVGYLLFIAVYTIGGIANWKKRTVDLIFPAIIFIAFFLSAHKITAYYEAPPPFIPLDIMNSFLDLKEIVPKNSPVFTWWDFGYPLMDVGEFAVYHDGGFNGGIRTYFVAKALVLDDQKKMYSIISAIDNYHFQGIDSLMTDGKTANKVVEKIMNSPLKPLNKNIIVLYTRDMIDKYYAFAFFGNWDFERKVSNIEEYRRLDCGHFDGKILKCQDYTVDIEKGLINNRDSIKRFIISDRGHVVYKKEYSKNKSEMTIEVIGVQGNIMGVYVVPESVFKSNFNQMYLLGNYDKNLFEEVYNNFPSARAFRVKVESSSG
ncbi:MAG: STT3 domain-containing protein [Geminocystis sp.]|nr:dolichyl-diphosphooligosaccharide--protein glycosyltransferase subunit STT3 [Geminocystis sp.]MCX8078742.1 dolichyl-diphosphooligosaccharide--protein glycosyltransferase subunit STT3 [Geminocystis sp.]MDW8462464.1 STT3 domain-containing protein [Geminocystis sp.]